MLLLLPFAWSLAVTLVATTDGLLIGAFNVQIFGQKKSTNETLMPIIVKIIRRYDVILIQEIRDSTDGTINRLMKALNTPGSVKFNQITSERLGSTKSKEQYSFLLRYDSGVSVLDKYQYQNSNVTFERPPFSVKLKSTKTEIKQFILTALHAKPEEAVKEIGQLKDVHSDLQRKWNTNNIIMMGDLNAACGYASRKALNNLEIRKDPQFHWLISDSTDTTTKQSNCSYDRYIMTGSLYNKSLVANSARVFRFDQEFSLPPELTTDVSDHYPIELRLRDIGTKMMFTGDSPVASSQARAGNVLLGAVFMSANLTLR